MGRYRDNLPPPCETLIINAQHGGAYVTIDRIDRATGQSIPVWVFHQQGDGKQLAVLYADPVAQQSGPPVGTMQIHKFSGNSDIVLRGTQSFKMKFAEGSYPYSVCKHKFSWAGVDGWTWGKEAVKQDPYELWLKDPSDRIIARYRKRPDGRGGVQPPTFELFVPPHTIDMDMFIVTGLAEVMQWDGENKEGLKMLFKIFTA